MNISVATTPGLSRPGMNGNEEVLRIAQSFRITGASPSDCFGSCPVVLSGVLPLCSDAIGKFYSSSRLGYVQVGGSEKWNLK